MITNTPDISSIKLKLKREKKYIVILLIINILLFVISIFHFIYYNYKLVLNTSFFLVSILNIIALFLMYRVLNKYKFYTYQYNYFKNQIISDKNEHK